VKKAGLAAEWKRYFVDYFFLLADARKKLPAVVFAMLVLVVIDLVCVGIVGPFASALTTGRVPEFMIGFEQRPRFAFLALGLVAVLLFTLRGWLGYRLHYAIVRFSEAHRAELTHRLMAAYQAESWEFHTSTSTSDIIHRITWYTRTYTSSTLVASLRFTTDALVGLAVLVLLLLVDFWSVLVLGVVLGTVFAAVQKFVRPRLMAATRGVGAQSGRLLRGVQQAIKGHRESRILGAESYFLAQVDDAAGALVDLRSSHEALLRVPGYSFEATLISVMVVLGGVTAFREGSTVAAVSTLGIFAAAAMRLLPVSTSLAREFNSLRSSRFVLTSLVQQLREARGVREPVDETTQPTVVAGEQTPFELLELRNVDFAYASAETGVLRNVNLTIRAGQTVGLMGPSGAGKSTLADLILGFLVPQSGTVRVNGEDVAGNLRAWWDRVAYIPQEVFVMDDSVRNNITFGVGQADVDAQRLDWAINQAQLQRDIAALPEGVHTQVGQDGAKLSGGQRQRIALARALYRQRELIILDEATSALDDESEQAVMAEIIGKVGSMAMLVIAHRDSTMARCQRRLEISDGQLRELESPA
jgi:ABC-type multidrug transport system fused ATPase/permease subunit